jgi:hypothetical protein
VSGIVVRIERVVLDGIPLASTDVKRFRASLESELARRLMRGSLSRAMSGGPTLATIAGSTIGETAGLSAAGLGARVAGAVYRGIGR